MSQLRKIVDGLRDDPTCVFAPPVGGPPPFLAVPDDLREFYEICGGLILFSDAPFAWEIVGPSGLAPTNLQVLGEQVEDDITSSWFVIAQEHGDSSALISIDLRADRLGAMTAIPRFMAWSATPRSLPSRSRNCSAS